MSSFLRGPVLALLPWAFGLVSSAAVADEVSDYTKDVVPILTKHCVGCHNNDDREGQLSLESYAELLKGGRRGPALQPGEINSSRMLLMVTGKTSPAMPPDKDARLSKAEIETLQLWIESGAKGPSGKEPVVRQLAVPKLNAAKGAKPVSGLALSPNGKLLAVARFGNVELLDAKTLKVTRVLRGHPGKVNDVEFSSDGKYLIAASGVSGLFGQAKVWPLKVRGQAMTPRVFEAHRDTMFSATLNANRTVLATASYDRKIILWDFESGRQLRTLDGHNGAVFDLAFHPSGKILASASADQTVKLWQVATGKRLDTLSQPLKEQYVVRFSPDGKLVVAGGLDNRIRVWKVVSIDQPHINPLLFSRIAHEGAVVQLEFANQGTRLISVADDRTMKLWDAKEFNQIDGFERQPDVVNCLVVAKTVNALFVGRTDGSLQRYDFDPNPATGGGPVRQVAAKLVTGDLKWVELEETEPNDSPDQATVLHLPAKAKGVIQKSGKTVGVRNLKPAGRDKTNPPAAGPAVETAQQAAGKLSSDVDYYRFDAKAGEQWVFEINAARSKSPLDSKIEILTADGKPIERVLLQAVRDSYITFRGIDSRTRDCRLHNWEEMDLNQYLYMNGEIVKTWLWPRGPDSGFVFYPHSGNRRTYFDTTATSHALHEPCYIVEPHPPGAKLISNGLPVFPVYYENDDDSRRKLGNDSRLTFTAPVDGEYLVRVVDVRGEQGPNFTYELTARPRKPDFSVRLNGANPTIDPGSGKEFSVLVDRIDGFEGPIEVTIDGLPPGFHASSPLVIEAGQSIAYGSITAETAAAKPTPENAKISKVVARAVVNKREVKKTVNNFGEIKLADKAKVLVAIGRDVDDHAAIPKFGEENPLELTIEPGQTMTARVHIKRNDFKGRIGFEAIAQNLPHGVIVDNIGLNGLLIVEGQNERQFFLTAAEWVPEQTRLFHLRSKEAGGQTSWPILLHVNKKRLAKND